MPTIYALDKGPQEACPIVFLHAFPLDHRMWEPQIAGLHHEFRIIAADFCGFGEEDCEHLWFTIDHMADDVFALIDSLGLRKPVLCGLSMGGYVAQRMIERDQDRFGGVILCDTRCEADDNAQKLKRAAAMKNLVKQGLGAFADTFIPLLLAPGAVEKKPEIAAKLRWMITAKKPEVVLAAQMALAARTSSDGILPEIRIPSLVIAGIEDQLSPAPVVRRISELVPDARFVEIPDAGHLANVENPAAFNTTLRDFLQNRVAPYRA